VGVWVIMRRSLFLVTKAIQQGIATRPALAEGGVCLPPSWTRRQGEELPLDDDHSAVLEAGST